MKISNKTISRVCLLLVTVAMLTSFIASGFDSKLSLILFGTFLSMFCIDEIVSYEWKEEHYERTEV